MLIYQDCVCSARTHRKIERKQLGSKRMKACILVSIAGGQNDGRHDDFYIDLGLTNVLRRYELGFMGFESSEYRKLWQTDAC